MNGFNTAPFMIQSVDSQFAYGYNNYRKPIKIPLHLLPYKGALPQPGELWLIEQTNGVWAFSSIIQAPDPPVVTGLRSDGTALANLLATLSDMGLIIDGTLPHYEILTDSISVFDSLST